MTSIRHDWTIAEVEALFALPFMDLIFRAQESTARTTARTPCR
jgi:hypothetical protein